MENFNKLKAHKDAIIAGEKLQQDVAHAADLAAVWTQAIAAIQEHFRIAMNSVKPESNISHMDGVSRCGNCGGQHRFDTSIPSPAWNEVVRVKGGSEFLYIQCVVLAFAQAGRAVRATLWGDDEGVTETEIFIRPKGTDESHKECHAQEEQLLGRIGELHNQLAAIRDVPAGDLVSRKAVLEIISQARVGERDPDLRSVAAAIRALVSVEE